MSTVPADALAANWPPEILQAYMAGVEKDAETCNGSAEAMFTDSEGEDEEDEDEDEESSMSSHSEHISHMEIDTGHASDIASDDSAFSSDDEFGEEEIREKQRYGRELVLGRVPDGILKLRGRGIVDITERYLRQLDDADKELAELSGTSSKVISRRKNVETVMEIDLEGKQGEQLVAELRQRSTKEIRDTEKAKLAEQLVPLAQALFRRERKIKGMQK